MATDSQSKAHVAPLLRATGLGVAYAGLPAVRDVSLRVQPGQVVALIGANGAGKTSLLNAIAGVTPHRGSVSLNGIDVSRAKPHSIARLGLRLVPEGRQAFNNLTVAQNLQVAAHRPTRGAEKNSAAAIQSMLELFPRLEERTQQKAGSLSGGEQQMLALARALVGQPEILLLDEPSNGLAPIIVSEVFAVLRRLKEEGVTILIAEQLVGEALRLADYAYVLERGVVRRHATSRDITADSDIVSAYLGDTSNAVASPAFLGSANGDQA